MNRNDMALARLVVSKGWLGRDEVEACLRDHQGQEDSQATMGRKARPLGVLMVAQGLITDAQLITLMDELRLQSQPKAAAPVSREKIGAIFVRLGRTTKERVTAALAEQKKLRSEGKIVRLGEILMRHRWVKRADVAEALGEQGKTVVACTSCGARYNVVRFQAWVEYRCKKCGDVLERATDMVRADETTTGLRMAAPKEEAPEEVRQASEKKGAHFGKFILLEALAQGPFGMLHRCWRKDEQAYAGIVFLKEKVDSAKLAKLFTQLRRIAREGGVEVEHLLEVGEHGGKEYVCVSLA